MQVCQQHTTSLIPPYDSTHLTPCRRQGPLPETFSDFWRMMWEQRSYTIVMMTRLEERARIKCDQYWPSKGTQTYGPVYVTLTEIQELASYVVRTFQLQRVRTGRGELG